MRAAAIVVYAYAALLLAGGAVAFVRGASKASLGTAILFGLALLECGRTIEEGNDTGLVAALAVAGLLSVLAAVRFGRTRRFLPSGLVAVLSLLVAGWLALALRNAH